MQPAVLIVLVNYKGSADTVECLESLLKLDYNNYKIAVVDNSEDDKFVAYLHDWAMGKLDPVPTRFPQFVYPPHVKPIALGVASATTFNGQPDAAITIITTRNNGFAAANNVVLKQAATLPFDYFWLLNNDTVVDAHALGAMVNASAATPRTGICGSKLLRYFEPATLQGVGGTYNKWLGRVQEIGASEEDRGQWDATPLTPDYIIGASMLVSKPFLLDVGAMEESYFLYYEELDWAIRARRNGWTMTFAPASKVYHKMGASINDEKRIHGGNSALADYYSVRNRLLITRKYFPVALLTLYPAFIKFIWNRIRLKQYGRIWMLFGILLNPKPHFKKS